MAACAALFVAGCAGSSSSKGSSKTGTARGKEIFRESCKLCHTLADANANGSAGPNLDELKPTREQLLETMENPKGGMPAHLVKGQDAEDVADYIVSVADGGSSESGDTAGTTGSTTATTSSTEAGDDGK